MVVRLVEAIIHSEVRTAIKSEPFPGAVLCPILQIDLDDRSGLIRRRRIPEKSIAKRLCLGFWGRQFGDEANMRVGPCVDLRVVLTRRTRIVLPGLTEVV